MPTDYSWPLIYSLINIKQQENKPACAPCARKPVCSVELCGKQDRFLVGGFLSSSSGSLLVFIINIPRQILLRLYLAKQTDPRSTAETFASAVVLISTGHWMVDSNVVRSTLWRSPADVCQVASLHMSNLVIPATGTAFS